ncbi:MAG: hypothetical protein NC935_04315, partial [Candidatus Omnitrophica bacterium]|nr:hypothetical protein [Candidatus Omnitrophota bacterium]
KGYNEWKGQWLIIEGVPVEFIPAEGLLREVVENAFRTEEVIEFLNINIFNFKLPCKFNLIY